MGSSERAIPFCVQYTFIIFGGGQLGQVLLRLGSALPQRPQAAAGFIRIFPASSATVSEMPDFNPNFSRNDFGIVICPLALIFNLLFAKKRDFLYFYVENFSYIFVLFHNGTKATA